MATNFIPGSSNVPVSEVELSISCRNLTKMDLLSMSDPLCVTYVRSLVDNRLTEYHRTEVIYNCHDPDFSSKVVMYYKFEEQQVLHFKVYDVDSGSDNLSDHDFIGMASCTLGQIISSGKVKIPLIREEYDDIRQKNYGFILIEAEELTSVKDEVSLKFIGRKLDRKCLFGWGWSDPFFEICKSMESGDHSMVYRSEVVKWNSNPVWKLFKIPLRTLCNGDYERSLKISCFDWRASGRHCFIGEFTTTLKTLSIGPGENNCYPCINPEKQARKGDTYENSGTIALDHYHLQKVYSFLDYIRGGTKLHCTFAIDFTGSNGDPKTPESLHYISPYPNTYNSYETAILQVGSIIEDYDSDKLFPVLGFGARLPPDGIISHEFFVNMNPESPFCHGVKGVLEAYHNCIRQIQLFGPTNFAPVINHVAKFAASYRNQEGSDYFILVILTDGVITDMEQTTKAIVKASVLPLSIIIIGIGNADFSAMETLDGDTVTLSAGREKAARDIVQFVPLNRIMYNIEPNLAKQKLTEQVLAEIPTQFISYMNSYCIVPKPPMKDEVFLPPDPESLIYH